MFWRDSLTRARRLLWVGLPLNLLGLVSCASVVGVFFTLAAWQITREDLERVERGELDPDAAPGISRLHDVATAGLLWCVFTFVLQIVLLQSGGEEAGWRRLTVVWTTASLIRPEISRPSARPSPTPRPRRPSCAPGASRRPTCGAHRGRASEPPV